VVAVKKIPLTDGNGTFDETIFSLIADDIQQQGYSIRPVALPEALTAALVAHQQTIEREKFANAGIGRGDEYLKNKFVRTDEICWIAGDTDASRQC
jgi:SM-20-related protein